MTTAKNKTVYHVYSRMVHCYGDDGIDVSDWNYEGSTYAVSEKQAINNVRHRVYGDKYSSQYKSTYFNAKTFEEDTRNWKAIKGEKLNVTNI